MCTIGHLYGGLSGKPPTLTCMVRLLISLICEFLVVVHMCIYIKEMQDNALCPKSELMVYLGHTEDIKACTFMWLSNNTVYTSTTALFDETLFLKCDKSSLKGTTRLNEPRAPKPSDANKDTTLGDLDDPLPPFEPKRDVPAPNGAQEAPEEEPPAV
jgi:hypothetical protein